MNKNTPGSQSSASILEQRSVLQGYEIGLGWTFAVDRVTGNMRITFAGADSAFIVFGVCTSYP